MELTDRIKYLIKINNMSSSVFADEIDVQRSSISHVLSGRNKPSLEFMQKILKRFPKVDASWLISGTPSQTNSTTTNPSDRAQEVAKDEEQATYSNGSLFDTEQKKTEVEKQHNASPDKQIVKIVAFYSDNTFEEYVQASKE